jgi:6-phosphogluconolactonase (cycloisomerase 2 family)
MLIYVGSYPPGVGVSVFTGGDPSGLRPGPAIAELPSPSFLAAHPGLPVTYAVSELERGEVHALVGEPGGTLGLLSSQESGGVEPCHLSVSDDCRYLLCANYGSGSVAVFPIGGSGDLGPRSDLVAHHGRGPDPQRQDGPHAHQVLPIGGEVVAVDLGTDTLYGYRLDGGRLHRTWTATGQPGAGPRHVAVHPSGLRLVADELSSTVSVYATAEGGLALLGTRPSTLVEPAGRNYPAEIAVSADGAYVHVSNRGNDTIATFRVNGAELVPVDEVESGGTWPRHFTVVGPWMFVANERSDTVAVLRLDPRNGVPRPTPYRIGVPRPACVLAWGKEG